MHYKIKLYIKYKMYVLTMYLPNLELLSFRLEQN